MGCVLRRNTMYLGFNCFREKPRFTCFTYRVSNKKHRRYLVKNHPFSTYAISTENLIFLTPIRTQTCAYQGVINASFPKTFAFILNE